MKRILFALLISLPLWAQGQIFNGSSADLPKQLKTEINRLQIAGMNEWAAQFNDFYITVLSQQERELLAQHMPKILVVPGFKLVPHGVAVLRMVQTLKDSSAVLPLSVKNYLEVILEGSGALRVAGEWEKYHDNLTLLVKEGVFFTAKDFKWRVEADKAVLKMEKRFDFKRDVFLEDPMVYFENVVIHFESDHTKAAIEGTTGVYDPHRWRWYGKLGRYTWERAGLDPRDAFADLANYDINLYENEWTADSVKFTYSTQLEKPLMGKLVEDYSYVADKTKLEYPQIYSFGEAVTIKEVLPGVDYKGCFALKGKRRYGSSDNVIKAELQLKRGDTLLVRAAMQEVDLDNPKVHQKFANTTVYLPKGDSLFHPAMDIDFDAGSRQLSLDIDRDSPAHWQAINSSFHRMDFYFDELRWNLNNDTIHFGSSIAHEWKKFAIQSQDYFSEQTYIKLNGTQYSNPIGMIYEVYLEDLKNQRKRLAAEIQRRERAKAREAEASSALEGFDFNNMEGTDGGSFDDGWGMEWNTGSEEDETVAEEEPDPTWNETVKEAEEAPLPVVKPNYTFGVVDVLKRFNKLKNSEKAGFIEQLNILDGAGFVYFNRELETFTIRPRLIRWAAAIKRWRDYDKLVLQTYVEKDDNAKLIYSDKTLLLDGCEMFYLNDSVLVSAHPDEYKVRLEDNRTMYWKGGLKAGKLNFIVEGHNNFQFDYPDNKVTCDTIRYLRFVPERDKYFGAVPVSSRMIKALKKLRIEDITGAIYITQPNNKNGLKPHHQYPVFDCYSEAFVYWKDSTIQNGQYPKEKLQFILDPFVIDSLETFDIRRLEFQGEFSCNGIFPAFRDTLKPVEDDTYGVHERTRNDGWEAYKGKGKFFNEVTMDSYGLWGKGKLEYLASTAISDTFTFHFDSVMAKTKSFHLKEGTFGNAHYPDIKIEQCKYTWYPHQDKLVLESKYKEPFKFYDGSSEFYGKIVITPKGIHGDGVLTMGPMQIESDSLNLTDSKMTAAEGTLRVTDPDIPTKQHFQATKAVVEYDLKKGIAEFYNREPGKANNTFAGINYSTTLGKGVYDKNKGTVTLSSNVTDPKGNVFTSTAKGQRGLAFNGQNAVYNTATQELDIDHADSIHVADAILFPDSGKVKISSTGKVSQLANARIEFDDSTRYHKLYEANALIADAYNYTASAKYTYANVLGKPQVITFDKISVKGDSLSVGTGAIKTEDEFYISEKIFFRSQATITANRRFLAFEGEVKVEFDNPAFNEWIAFKEDFVNPDTVIVTINADKLRGKTVGMSYQASLRKRQLYNLFMEQKTTAQRKDRDVLTAYGALTYDKAIGKFRVGPRKKLLGEEYVGNVMETDDKLEVKTARGLIKLPPVDNPLANTLKVRMAGAMTQNGSPENMTGTVAFTLDLPADVSRAFYLYGGRMMKDAGAEFPAELEARHTQEFLSELMAVGQESPEALPQQVWVKDAAKTPDLTRLDLAKYLPSNIVMSNVKLTYCPNHNALYSSQMADLLCMTGGGERSNIMKQVDTRIVYSFGRPDAKGNLRSDTLFYYVSWNKGLEYFHMEVIDGYVKIFTSHIGTNEFVQETIGKMAKKPEDYKYKLVLGTEDEMSTFVNRFSLKYSPTGCTQASQDSGSSEEEGTEEEAPAEDGTQTPPEGATPPAGGEGQPSQP